MVTTTVLSTTVSAQQVDFIGASLALKGIRPEDVPLHIPKGSVFLTADPSAVEANKLYKAVQPECDVLYAAPTNRLADSGAGNLNAVLVNQPVRFENHPLAAPYVIDFTGGSPNPTDWWKWPDTAQSAVGVVVGAYAVDSDFSVVLENPITSDLFQARVLGDPGTSPADCAFTVRDLKADLLHYPDYREQPPDKNQYAADFLQNHRLEELIQPGDMVFLSLAAEVSHPIKKDGVQVANELMVERLDGVEKLTALFSR